MSTAPAHRSRLGLIVAGAWAFLPVTVVAFVVLRTMPGHTALALSQVVYLLPIALAAVAAEMAFLAGPRGIERRAWGLVSLTALLLLLSEGYFSWYQVFIGRGGPASPSAFDALNGLASLVIALALAQLVGVGRLGRSERFRLFFDAVAFFAVTFAALYHFVLLPNAGSAPWTVSARGAAYSLVGVLILIGMAWMVANSKPGVERRIVALVALALAIYGVGMVVWPATSGQTSSKPDVAAAGAAAVYLLGYYLLLLAGLTRVLHRDGPWRIVNRRLVDTEGVWASTLLSLYVLVGVVLMGAWVYRAPLGADDSVLYLVAATLATLALVARTGVTAVDTVLARSMAERDTVTVAYSGASFLRRCDEALARAQRAAEPLSIVVFDIDRFSRFNEALGYAAGDAVLAEVAEATVAAVGSRGEVFRLSADEFAVLCPGDEAKAAVVANDIQAALRLRSPVEGQPLSASLGVAGCEAGPCGREELMRRANAAQAWAKYHGKDRVVRFDARIVRALGVEERLRVHEDRIGLDMARALASAADARDASNYYHSRNVAALSVLLSEALDLDPERVHRIEIAAMLHDCGKLGLVDALLANVLRSSRQQMAAREHTTLGETLARSVGTPGVPAWVRHHHERWDGAGYPDGLAGESIPLESRIIALADAFDAMTSGVRSRSPMSRGAALQEIDLGMGSRFDPLLAEKFIQLVAETASLGWSDEWVSP